MEDYIAAFYENVCIYFEMKSEMMNFARYLRILNHLFLHNLGVMNAKLSNNSLY